LALLPLLLAACLPAPAAAEGRYTRRQAQRGEQTDTSPKLGAFSFINDSEETDRRLAFFVDAGAGRNPLLPDLVPFRIGIAQRGSGSPLALSPDRFRLSWAGAAQPLTALRQDEVLTIRGGRAALGHARRMLRARHAPLPFESTDGLRVPTAFHADPASGVFLNDETSLPASAWFTDVIFFRLPPGLELFGERMTLSFVDRDEAELVGVVFRVEEDTQLNRDAFRRAKKARKQEDKRARKEARRQAEKEALGPSPSR
jgi:hypothetical protein